jgi:hypothetical protein
MADNITIDIVESPTNVNIGLSTTTPDTYSINTFPGGAVWGNIVGILSAQNDLWTVLSSIFLSADLATQTLTYSPETYELTITTGNTVNLSSIVISPSAAAIFSSVSASGNLFGQNLYLQQSISANESLFVQTITAFESLFTKQIETESINATKEILSGGIDLFDLFLTSDEENQTLTYDITGEEISIDRGNTISLSALSYRNVTDPTGNLETIEQFAFSYNGNIHPGYNVTLYNGRVYTFAGTDKNNPNHYLEVNTNPYTPIYREVPLSGNSISIDSFYLGHFKSAKYTLQVETNFNNDIYYSEINVVGSVQTSTGVASEYGQIFTDQLVLNYSVNVNLNTLELIMHNSYDPDPSHKYIVKGHRTNFYKI